MKTIQTAANGLLAAFCILAPAAQATAAPTVEKRPTGIEVLARMKREPERVTVTPDERIIFSIRRLADDEPAVVELLQDGSLVPFPNAQWSAKPDAQGVGLARVTSLVSNAAGQVWMLDAGDDRNPAKLVGWDTKKNELVKAFAFPPNPNRKGKPILHDVVYVAKHNLLIVGGMEKDDKPSAAYVPLLLVIKIHPEQKHMELYKLAGMSAAQAEKVTKGLETGTRGAIKGERLNIPLAVDPAQEWVYFGFADAETVWRISAADLANPEVRGAALGDAIKDYGTKSLCNGMAAADGGVLYFTDENANGIGVFEPARGYRVIVKDSMLSVPGGITLARDGYLYVTVNRSLRAVEAPKSEAAANPYALVRYKPAIVAGQ
jgi:hypothetical protein